MDGLWRLFFLPFAPIAYSRARLIMDGDATTQYRFDFSALRQLRRRPLRTAALLQSPCIMDTARSIVRDNIISGIHVVRVSVGWASLNRQLRVGRLLQQASRPVP